MRLENLLCVISARGLHLSLPAPPLSVISQKIQTFNLLSRMRNNKILLFRGMRTFHWVANVVFCNNKNSQCRAVCITQFAVVTENYFCACKLTRLARNKLNTDLQCFYYKMFLLTRFHTIQCDITNVLSIVFCVN